jgi:hypothetical protein
MYIGYIIITISITLRERNRPDKSPLNALLKFPPFLVFSLELGKIWGKGGYRKIFLTGFCFTCQNILIDKVTCYNSHCYICLLKTYVKLLRSFHMFFVNRI